MDAAGVGVRACGAARARRARVARGVGAPLTNWNHQKAQSYPEAELRVRKPAASSSSILAEKNNAVEVPDSEGGPATPIKGLLPSKASPYPRLYHTTAEVDASSRFFSRMFVVALAVTEPASSMPKPHCIKKTLRGAGGGRA